MDLNLTNEKRDGGPQVTQWKLLCNTKHGQVVEYASNLNHIFAGVAWTTSTEPSNWFLSRLCIQQYHHIVKLSSGSSQKAALA